MIESNRSRMAVLLASVILLPSLVRAQALTTLEYHWKQGEAVVYRTSLKTDSTVSGMPGMGDVTLSQTMTQRIRLLPAAVAPDGMVTLQQTIEAVSVEMATPMGRMAYDSANPRPARDEASASLASVFGGIVGSTISVMMAPSGAIHRIEGNQKIIDRIMMDLPGDRGAAQMAQSLKSVLSEQAIRAALEQSFPRLPLQPVKPGDTWTAQISLGSDVIGKISGTQTLTLKSLAGGTATIDVAVALKQESSPPLGPSGMTVKLGESRGAGQVEFDTASGRIRKATMTTDMPSTMTAMTPDGRPSTMKNVTKTSMTMEEIR